MKTKHIIGVLGLSALSMTGVMFSSATQAKPLHANATHPRHKITVVQARGVALKTYPGKIIGRSTLENEEGKWQYSVNVRSGKVLREIMVGAYSGKIEDVEVTTRAEENAEAKAEKQSQHSTKTSKPNEKR